MKKIYLILLLLFVFSGYLSAQNSCGLYIKSDFDSECILTTTSENGDTTHVEGSEDCWVACKGNSVQYTAVCDHDGEISWEITGADHIVTDTSGSVVIVTWGDGDAGHLSASINIGDTLFCTVEVCVFLIESPQIASASVPGFYYDSLGLKHIEICLNETIELIDLSSAGSTPITGYLWSSPFGNGSSSNYIISPNQPGDFAIAHSVQNECGCIDEEKIYVRVTDPIKLNISCYGTACAGSTTTYSADGPDCTQFMWHVEGGAITQGQGTSTITVVWGAPSSGYGVISIDGSFCDDVCSSLISVKVPIISDNVEITGPDTVCVGDYEIYSLPAWGATSYQWEVNPPTGAYIHGGTDPNQCLVEFRNAGTYEIKVSYRCAFLDCGWFTATKKVYALKPLTIVADNSTFCEGDVGVFTTNLPTEVVKWYVYDSVSTLLYAGAFDSLHYHFDRPGTYRITAFCKKCCNIAEFTVSVLSKPPALTDVAGPYEACPYSTIQLSATPTHPRYYLEWKPLCADASPTVHDGDEFSVSYGPSVCGVAVYQIDSEYGCCSGAHIHQVDTFHLLPLSIPPVTTVCAGATVNFYAPNQLPEVTYQWTVEPVSAASVLDDHLLPHAEILTNHLYNAQTPYLVDVTLRRTYCSILTRSEHISIRVEEATPPTLDCPDTVCAGHTFQFSAIGGAVGNENYRWSFADTSFTYYGATIHRTFLGQGNVPYTLTYFPDNGCDSIIVASSVYVCPTPSSQITCTDSVLHVSHQENVSYVWLFDGDTLPNETSDSLVFHSYGNYCCIVTSTHSPYCSSLHCYSHQPPVLDTCETISLTIVGSSCNTVVVKVNHPEYGPFTWSSQPSGTTILPSQTSDTATFVFHTSGTHTITARSEHNGQCYRGSIDYTVDYVLRLGLSHNCDGSLTVTDQSSYRGGYSIPSRTVTLNGGNAQQMVPPQMSFTYPDTDVPYGIGIVTLSIGSCSQSETIVIDSLPSIIGIDALSDVCEQTPVLFAAHAVGSGLTYRWDFGDTSYNFGNNTYHTYDREYGNYTYNVTLTVTDANGCTATFPHTISVYVNNLSDIRLRPTLSNPVCPDYARQIECQSIIVQSSTNYTWYGDGIYLGSTVNIPSYNVYSTGDYRVHILDNDYGCRAEAMCNVGFLNEPTARISGRSEYCYGEEVALTGFSGSHNTYQWTFNDTIFGTFTDGNIHFMPPQSGQFVATLEVTSADNCVATASYAITIHQQVPPPAISFYGNECVHQPPVNVRSDAHLPLLWSNGFFGDTALYYTPGYISAHYMDTLTGCPSENAYLFIPPAPDFKALLTGCYHRCNDFPDSIPVFGLYPYTLPSFHWKWCLEGNTIVQGYQISPWLPLPSFGTYHLDAFYGNGCSVSSPTLTIVEEPFCPCDSVTVTVNYECKFKDCSPNYLFHIEICNNSSRTLEFANLFVNTASHLVSSGLPVIVPPHNCKTIHPIVEFLDFENGFVEFTLLDKDNGCTLTFSCQVNWETCISPDGCKMFIDSVAFNTSLSSPHQSSYFDFLFQIPSATTSVVAFWSDPPVTVNYVYVPSNHLVGLLMLDYAALTRLVADSGKICFHAILCINGTSLCHSVCCIPAQDLFGEIPPSFRRPSDSLEIVPEERILIQPQDSPYLVPNPARDEVSVMGIAPETVAEITILSLEGRQAAVFRNDYRFNVSNLARTTYIIRIITTSKQVYYLKLVKQ